VLNVFSRSNSHVKCVFEKQLTRSLFVLSRSNAIFFFRALFLQEKGRDKYKYIKMQQEFNNLI